MKRSTLATLAGTFALSAAAIVAIARPSDRTSDVIKEPTAAPTKAQKDNQPVSPLDFKLKSIDGKDMDLAQFKGKAVLLVNVASKCGLTPQYKALQAVYEKY